MREINVKHGTILVDDEDFERVSRYRWFSYLRRGYTDAFYAIAKPRENGKRLNILLHRFVMNANAGQIVDHINRNGLDCRKSTNLRFCTTSQNAFNRKPNGDRKYKGITFDSRYRTNPWKSKIVLNGKAICLGMFATEEQAAEAYRLKAIEIAGEFARQETPEPAETPALLGAAEEMPPNDDQDEDEEDPDYLGVTPDPQYERNGR